MTIKIEKPTSKPSSVKPSNPVIDTPRGVKKPMQLKLDVEVIKDFKQTALDQEKNLNDLFVEIYNFWKANKQ